MKGVYRLSICLLVLLFSIFFGGDISNTVKAFGGADANSFLRFEEELINLNSTMSAQSLETENVGEFSLKRLIVNGKLSNTYGAVKKVSYNNLHVLCYSSEEDTKYAYDMLSTNIKLSVIIDKVEKLEEYAEKEYDYNEYDNWAAESIDIGGYREFLVNNNVNKEVVVVVLDTGINTSHPMFKNRLVTDSNGKIKGFSYYDSTYRYSYNNLSFDSDDEKKYSFEDDDGHGSHVSGIITSLTPENVKVLNIKIGNEIGRTTTDIMISAYLRVINIYSKEYNVVATNLSFSGGGKDSEKERDTFNEQCYEPLLNLNIIPITAAGNDSEENNIEGLKAVVVSSLSKQNSEYVFDYEYSNYGEFVDISAPGTNIMSAGIAETDKANESIVSNSGTSMASPQVAGVVALLYLNPNLPSNFTALDIEQMLYNYTIDLGEYDKDIYYGEGMLNLKYFEIEDEEGEETLSFYKNGVLVDKYTKHENFDDLFNLEIKCSDPTFKIIYTTDMDFPTYSKHLEYNSKLTVRKSITIYAMGIKIEDNQIVEKTDMYYISYFYSLTPLEETFTVSFRGYLENYTGNYTHLVIPSTLHGQTIKGIEPSVFKNSNLESIILPETVEIIGGYVFQGSKNLKYVYAPGVTKIYIAAFMYCESIKFVSDEHPDDGVLEGVYLPNLTETVGDSFSWCINLESVNLSKLEILGDAGGDFYGCSKLKFVNLPNITSITKLLFYDCFNLKGEFYIGDKVSSVISSAFKGTKIEWFNVHDDNKYLYSDGVGLYSSGKFIAYAPGRINEDYEILSSVIIDDRQYTIIEINEAVIVGGTIKNLTIPYSITKINGNAFYDTFINNLYYYAEDCGSEGYWNEERFAIIPPFGVVKTVIIGENVKNVPSMLFQGVLMDNIIINSYETKLSEQSFYRFSYTGEDSPLDTLVLNFDNQITNEYVGMLIRSDLFMINENLNYLYVKNDMVENLFEGYIDPLNYKYYINEHVVYSKKPINDRFIINASSNDGGTISNIGITIVNSGDSKNYKFVPNKGYKVIDVIIDSVHLSGDTLKQVINEGYTFENILKNHEITVLFDKEKEYSVHVINEFENNDDQNFETIIQNSYGSDFTIKLEYGDKFVVDSVRVNGEDYDINENKECYSRCYVVINNITQDMIINVKYIVKKYIIQATIEGNGAITPNGDVVVEYGGNQKFVFVPNDNYRVSAIVVDNVYLSGSLLEEAINEGFTFEDVQQNHEIKVVFVKKQYTIKASLEGNGEITPKGDVVVEHGEDQGFRIQVVEGYHVENIYIGSRSLSGDEIDSVLENGYTFTNVTSNGSIRVIVVKDDIKYRIYATAGDNGSISPRGILMVNKGENVHLTFTPNEGYRVNAVVIDDVYLSGEVLEEAINEGFTFEDVKQDHVIKVLFTIKKYSIHVMHQFEESPNLNSSDYISIYHGNSYSFVYVSNDQFVLNRVQIDGREYSIEDNLYCDNNNCFVLIEYITKDMDVLVKYELREYIIQASLEGYGYISPKGDVKVKYGANQTFEIGVVEGYHVENIYIGSRSLSKDEIDSVLENGYTFTNVTSNGSIRVMVEEDKIAKHKINAIVEGQGTISPSGEIGVVEGENQKFVFVPNENHRVSAILVDDVYLSGSLLEEAINEGFTFEDVVGIHSIKVVFVEKEKFKIDVNVLGEGNFESQYDLNNVSYGGNVVIKFIANEGYKIDKVWVGKAEVDLQSDTLNILDVKEDMVVTVSFEKDDAEMDSGNATKKGLSCAREEGGSISDFLFIVLTMLGFAIPRKKFC